MIIICHVLGIKVASWPTYNFQCCDWSERVKSSAVVDKQSIKPCASGYIRSRMPKLLSFFCQFCQSGQTLLCRLLVKSAITFTETISCKVSTYILFQSISLIFHIYIGPWPRLMLLGRGPYMEFPLIAHTLWYGTSPQSVWYPCPFALVECGIVRYMYAHDCPRDTIRHWYAPLCGIWVVRTSAVSCGIWVVRTSAVSCGIWAVWL